MYLQFRADCHVHDVRLGPILTKLGNGSAHASWGKVNPDTAQVLQIRLSFASRFAMPCVSVFFSASQRESRSAARNRVSQMSHTD